MRTTALSGEVRFDGGQSRVVVDLHRLTSGQSLRDGYVRRTMFPQHPTAVFNLDHLGPLPPGFTEGQDVETRRAGVLEIRGIEAPLEFDLKVHDQGDVVEVQGRTGFIWQDFGLETPTAGIVLSVSDQVDVEVTLVLKPLR